MEDVLKEHRQVYSNGTVSHCTCEGLKPYEGNADYVSFTPTTYAQHLAAMLKEAGFDSQHEAWDEGFAVRDAYEFEPVDTTNPYPATEGES